MFGGWQLGNVSVQQYALRHNAFVRAMRKIDPSIRVVAVARRANGTTRCWPPAPSTSTC